MVKTPGPSGVVLMLDQSLGELRIADETVVGVDLWPSSLGALRFIRAARVPVTVCLPGAPGREALQAVRACLPKTKLVQEGKKGLDAVLDRLRSSGSKGKGKPLFVSADRTIRYRAVRKGFLAMPHPQAAALAVAGESLQFALVRGEREGFSRLLPRGVVPYHVERSGDGTWRLLALLTRKAIAGAVSAGLDLRLLPLDPAKEDPVLVRLEGAGKGAPDLLAQRKILAAEGSRVLIAQGPRDASEVPEMHGVHGHLELLFPSPELLEPPVDPANEARGARLRMARWPLDRIEITDLDIALPHRYWICPASAASIQTDVNRYSGVADLDAAGPVVSRHSAHPDNGRAVDALIKDLRDIGYCAYRHSFLHNGQTLHNVIADLPGRGLFRIDPDILERLRELFYKYPFPVPPEHWKRGLERILGKDWLRKQDLDRLAADELRTTIEDIFDLRPWYPWWRKLCPLYGLGSQIVLVGCHLDSTAGRDASYDPAADAAPGADDDASGMAATLAIARQFWNLRGSLRHTVRFCFFNAEESGRVGSQAYAAKMKSLNAPIKAVVCMDMIGFNAEAQRVFEIHAGYTDPAIRDLSDPIASDVASWAATLGALAPAQIYRGTDPSSVGTDRDLFDGAINRSDHAAFHQQGYPAVVVSEDFFANLSTEPAADANPDYHRATDTAIDAGFAADIACAVAHAVKEMAG